MEYGQVKYIATVASCGSINKAAAKLGIAQPNLSHAINNLEREIGTKLLLRTNKGISLTPEGKQFTLLANGVVTQMDTLKKIFLQNEEQSSVLLTIATSPSQITLACLAELNETLTNERVVIDVSMCTMVGIVDMVKNLQAEIGVMLISDMQRKELERHFHQNQLVFEAVSRRPFCVNMGKKNPLYGQKTVRFEDLLQFPLARIREDKFTYLEHTASVDSASIKNFKKVYYFDNDETILNFVRQTNAVKLGYYWCADDYEKMGIHTVLVENNTYQVTLGWLHRKNDLLSPGGKRFIEIFRKHYDDSLYV